MINLIPKKEKKKIIRGFHLKLIVLFLTISGFSFFLLFIAILPAYFLFSVKNNIINTKLEIQKKEPVPLFNQQTLLAIKNLDGKLDLVENTKNNKFTVSEKVINAIILRKMSNIKITDISYKDDSLEGLKNNQAGRKISIQGEAPSREVLLSFRRALEDGITFKQVDLPISNFVKGSNIKFYLSLIPE
ncbi:MAG: hypothetical protein US12_C0005G0016 [Parcubacteria group bacterium GW2011_GWA2_36_24]|nr:MAG: hypothetical protein US12_C0005G0016 [Parcubacteria group bacterium GW2011_GWA2_36_24]